MKRIIGGIAADLAPIEVLTAPGRVTFRATCACCDGHEEWNIATRIPPVAIVKKHFTTRGWRIRRRAACPNCTNGKRESPEMAKISTDAQPATIAPAAPTDAAKDMRRMAYMAIEDGYDQGAKRYRPGHSDEAVAKAVGCAVALVAKIREDFFGPNTPPNEIEQVEARLVTISAELAVLQAEIAGLRKRNGWA
ncbi:MAG TPA: hypothetical protein VN222_10475 [Novosphingobium sp.]|nr:hypothetical protein [Novosphingobium sp.]